MKTTRAIIALVLATSLGAFVGCEEGAPTGNNPTGSGGGGGAGGSIPLCLADESLPQPDGPSCMALADDYMPRDNGSANDSWPACISDGNTYVPFDMNISALSRVAAFEELDKLLGFGGKKVPSTEDFLNARVIYLQDQGLESRVSRREDEHYPPAPLACRDMTPEEQAMYPDRCVGPVKIRPILNAAFEDGINGKDPVKSAARIESALLWFFYMSIFKEATTSAINAVDTDSMWAKYTGGEPREGGIGLSRYVRARNQQAHDRIWDGLLAVRCWRDLDNPQGTAQDLVMRDRARAQLDRALLRGLALIVRQRAQSLPCEASWESVRILGGVLDREASLQDQAKAAVLRAELVKESAAEVDVAAVVDALDTIFPCP